MKGYLYLITNKINGKQYVGKTYDTIESRWQDHISKSRSNSNRPLCRAIRKYGPDNFSIEAVAVYDKYVLETAEEELIEKLNTFGSQGYNATKGGDGRPYLNLDADDVQVLYTELKSVKAVARLLKVDQQSVRKLLPVIATNYGNDANKKRFRLIEEGLEFDSIADCAKLLIDCEITKADIKGVASHIREVAAGKRKSAYGYTYEYI